MPTPKPVAPDGDPPDNRTTDEQGPSASRDQRPEDPDPAGTHDELPESLPAGSTR
jgi:hypothetical protein